MKQLILIGLLLVQLMPGLRADGAPPPPRPPEVKEEPKEAPKVSTGERIEIPDVGFSIVPPNGWMVHKNSHGSSLLFEAPKQPNQIYQPTLQVMVFSKLRYIDEVTMKEYGDLIVEKFGKMSNRVTGYRLRDAAIQRLETGDPSILYYTEFQYDDVPIMQMHILVSSATNHFVMTYTDVAKVFEDESSPGLAIAYTSMHSAQLATRPPWRWRGFAMGGGAALLLILGWFTLHFMRARRLARLGQRIEEEDNKEITRDEESQYYSRHSPATQAESHAGDDEWPSAKPQSKSAAKVSQVHSSHFDEDDEPEVSDVVPISTLEKSLHPARKRRQEAAAQHQAPPMGQPTSQHPPMSNHQPVSNHPPMMQQPQGMQQPGMHPSQGMQQPGMHPSQGMQQPGMHPSQGMQQPGMHPSQGMQQPGMHPSQGTQQPGMHPSQGMQQPGMHPSQGMQNPQQPMSHGMQNPQQGMQKPGMQNHQQGVQNHQPMSHGMQNPHEGMQQPGMQNHQHGMQQPGMHPSQGMQNPQQPMSHGMQNPQQGMQQPGMQNHQQGVQNQQPMSHGMQNSQQSMPHGMQPQQGMQHPGMQNAQGMPQPGMHNTQQGMPQPGMQNTQQGMQHPGMQNTQQGMQHPGMHNAQQGMQPGMQDAAYGMPNPQQGMPQPGMQPSQGMQHPQQGMQNPQAGMHQPGMQNAPYGTHNTQQAMQQHGMQQPEIHPAQNTQHGMQHQGMPSASNGPQNTQQGMQHQGTQNPGQHAGTPSAQRPAHPSMAPQPGSQQHMSGAHDQPLSHSQAPLAVPKKAVPAPQQSMPQGVPTSPAGMPQPGMQHTAQSMNQPQAGYPQAAYQDQPPVSQHPYQPPMAQQNSFVAQSVPAKHPSASDAASHHAPPAPMPVAGSQPMPFAHHEAPTADFMPNVQPHSQPPVSEQPAYVHQAHASAAQAYAGAPAPGPVVQAFAPPPAAPAMPDFAPAAQPVSEHPITQSRTTQSHMNKKQPLSQNLDDEPEMTEEARLSEILPKAGTIEKSKPKRKGLFWRKKTEEDDDQEEGGDDKVSWNVPASKKTKGQDNEDADGDADAGGEWAVTPSKGTDAALVEKDEDESQESEAWAPEATKRSDPKKDSLLNETQGPQRLVRRTPEGPVTKANNAAVTEDGWNLNQDVASGDDEEDEEEVG